MATWKMILSLLSCISITYASADAITGCGGFVEASPALIKSRKTSDPKIDYSDIVVELYTTDGLVKDATQCAPNGYYFIPVYDKGSFQLKIKGPDGWAWEPDQVPVSVDDSGCNGNEDINFKFTGFTISGRILGGIGGDSCTEKNGGPADINVELISIDQRVSKSVSTTHDGRYIFKNVTPGPYKLVASHPAITVTQTGSSEIFVGFGNIEVDDFFHVSGYNIEGLVVSQGNPVLGVHLFLFSEDVKEVSCSQGFEDAIPLSKTALCHSSSDASGKFLFSNIPCGKYTLVPFYKGENTTFDVSPPSAELLVKHSHVFLPEPFQVTGFSVGGRVVDSEGNGIQGVTIFLDGLEKASTDINGFYKLDQVTSRQYAVKAEKQHLKFSNLENFMILPNMALIPEIKVSHYELCGSVKVESAEYSRKRQVALTHGPEKPQATTTDEKGNFCFEVQPGEYRVSPLINPNEKSSGLLFSPSFLDITLNKPLLDVQFSQALVSIRGSVLCKRGCDSMVSISLFPLASKSIEKSRSLSLKDSTGKFAFENVLPSKYRLEISHLSESKLSSKDDDWCWEKNAIDADVGSSDLDGITFVQKGYWLSIESTHDVSTRIVGPEQTLENLLVNKGLQRFCLESHGLHSMQFYNSCISFGAPSLSIEIPTEKPLYLTGQKYLVGGEIHVDVNNCQEANELSQRIIVEVYEGNLLTENITDVQMVATANESSSKAIYQYTYWAKPGAELTFVPRDIRDSVNQISEKKVLFYPKDQHFLIKEDGCQPHVNPFVARFGQYIQGSVDPATTGVDIKVYALDDSVNGLLKKGDLAYSISTDVDGLFVAGPLYDDISYQVEALKAGFHLKSLGGYRFTCQKLSHISVHIISGEGAEETLPSVLLSLSGEDGYRNNAVTNPGEPFGFDNLFAGNFYLRPLMKEYSFSPSSLAIDLGAGKSKEVTFVAHRVSYSVLGTVTLLSGEPKEGIYLEARSLSRGYYEETITDASGKYRLRGLLPNTSYSIKVLEKENMQMKIGIERASPSSVVVQVGSENINGLDFVVFEKPETTIVTGYVEGDGLEGLQPHLSVRVKSSKEPFRTESVLPLSISYFFEVQSLPKGKYTMELLSALSSRSHKFKSSIIEVDLNKHSHIHIGALTYKVEEHHHKQEVAPVPILPIILGALAIFVFVSMPRLKDAYNWAAGLTPSGSGTNPPKKDVRKPTIRKRTY